MGATILSFEGRAPQIDATAWVAPTAAVIGDVTIGPGSSIWYNCVLRGDTNFIRIGARTNIQDGSILHVNRDTFACILGDDITVGHGAIVHACTVEDGAFIGMGATVLDGALVAHGAVLAAGALLSPGKQMGPGELWAGVPARRVRVLSAEERAGFAATGAHYVELAERHHRGT